MAEQPELVLRDAGLGGEEWHKVGSDFAAKGTSKGHVPLLLTAAAALSLLMSDCGAVAAAAAALSLACRSNKCTTTNDDA